MVMILRCALTLFLLIALPFHAFAVEPGEMLDDAKLEARARVLSAELRCMVCQNESIDDSHADLARDLRLLVRERLQAGESDDQIRAFLVQRYGDFILLRPPFKPATLLLWAAPALVLLTGAAAIILALRRHRARSKAPYDLTAAEKSKLETLLDD